MKAGLVIGGVEIAVDAASGPLERLACERYAWFLGRIANPRRWMTLAPLPAPRTDAKDPFVRVDDDGGVHLDHPWFVGRIAATGKGSAQVLPNALAVDALLKTIVAVVAPEVGSIVVEASGIASRGRGHLLLGEGMEPALRQAEQERRPAICGDCVAISNSGTEWLLSATPFGVGADSPGRSADLRAVWLAAPQVFADREVEVLGGADCAGLLLEHAVVPAWNPRTLDLVLDVCARIASSIPAARLSDPAAAHWDRIDELAAALGVHRALSAAQPEIRGRLLRGALRSMSVDLTQL